MAITLPSPWFAKQRNRRSAAAGSPAPAHTAGAGRTPHRARGRRRGRHEVEMVPVVLHHRIAHVHAFTDGLAAPELTRDSQAVRPTLRPNLCSDTRPVPAADFLPETHGRISEPSCPQRWRFRRCPSLSTRSLRSAALELAKRSTPSAAPRATRVGKKGMLLYIDQALSCGLTDGSAGAEGGTSRRCERRPGTGGCR